MSARTVRYWPRCTARLPRFSARVFEPRRELTVHQVRAIGLAMRMFVEADLDDGVSPEAMQPCAACRMQRPLAGSIRYDGLMLCNGCATDYEVRRARGLVQSIGGYVKQLRPRGR